MILIKPKYIILSIVDSYDMLGNIERAGRTCYKSEAKITVNSASDFIKMLIKNGHESVLEHESISVRFICDRGVSHELVRHRLSSFSQESTGFCSYKNEITFIIPEWFGCEDETSVHRLAEVNASAKMWCDAMKNCETAYHNLLQEGWQPQQARSVLPNSLKTEIVVTANIREWRLILKQRTSKTAHPQMRELMCPLLDELKEYVPPLFKDINYER
jgi:thymidylate synthase (FAD)